MRKDHSNQHSWVTLENGIRLLLFLGMVVRIWYAIVTPVTVRGHDINELSPESYGKAAYLLRLVMKGELPDSYFWQNYQQPFYFLLSAGVSKVMSLVSGIQSAEFLLHGGKIVSCLASCLFLILAERLLREFSEARVRIFGVAILSVTPSLILTAGRLGEDALTGFFMLAVLYVTLKWEKSPDWKTTLLLAFLYGCGMMTKVSLAFPAAYTAYIFWKNRKGKHFIPKMIVFAVISLPLGLWYSVRNYLLFGQPFGYVTLPGEKIYTGQYSYVARFFSFSVTNWFRSPYTEPFEDYNLPVYLLKSELFGEFQYDSPIWLSVMLLAVSTVLTLVVAVYGSYVIYRRICGGQYRGGQLRPYSFGLLFGGYAAFSYLRFPYGCSMDFRYYLMLTVCKVLVLGCLLQIEPDGRFADELKILQKSMKVLCVLFTVLSTAFLIGMLL